MATTKRPEIVSRNTLIPLGGALTILLSSAWVIWSASNVNTTIGSMGSKMDNLTNTLKEVDKQLQKHSGVMQNHEGTLRVIDTRIGRVEQDIRDHVKVSDAHFADVEKRLRKVEAGK